MHFSEGVLQWEIKVIRLNNSSDGLIITVPGNQTSAVINLDMYPDLSPDCENTSSSYTYMFAVRVIVKVIELLAAKVSSTT